MFSYKIEANENNQWAEVRGWGRPFTDGQTLDDSLDSGKINLSFVTYRVYAVECGSQSSRGAWYGLT